MIAPCGFRSGGRLRRAFGSRKNLSPYYHDIKIVISGQDIANQHIPKPLSKPGTSFYALGIAFWRLCPDDEPCVCEQETHRRNLYVGGDRYESGDLVPRMPVNHWPAERAWLEHQGIALRECQPTHSQKVQVMDPTSEAS